MPACSRSVSSAPPSGHSACAARRRGWEPKEPARRSRRHCPRGTRRPVVAQARFHVVAGRSRDLERDLASLHHRAAPNGQTVAVHPAKEIGGAVAKNLPDRIARAVAVPFQFDQPRMAVCLVPVHQIVSRLRLWDAKRVARRSVHSLPEVDAGFGTLASIRRRISAMSTIPSVPSNRLTTLFSPDHLRSGATSP